MHSLSFALLDIFMMVGIMKGEISLLVPVLGYLMLYISGDMLIWFYNFACLKLEAPKHLVL